MTFWNSHSIEPLRKRSFTITFPDVKDFVFLAKSVNKPTVETEVNEYRLINQIVKFPTTPKWNDITIKFVDTKAKRISDKLYNIFFKSTKDPKGWTYPDGCPTAIAKNKKWVIDIHQHGSDGKVVSEWHLKGAIIKSINFGDNDYSSDDFVEVEIALAYDYASLTGPSGNSNKGGQGGASGGGSGQTGENDIEDP